MENILDLINQNPWLDVVFLLLTLSSIFSSFWFYFRSKKSKKPTYTLRTFNLIKEKINKIDSVEIQYHNNKIDNLSISKIAIWNNGRETIISDDIAQNDPFLINIEKGFSLLDYDILFEKNKANGFSLNRRNANSIEIRFDYFDFNEGIIIQLYHTATEEEKISVKGSFKGTKNIERNSYPKNIFADIFYKALVSETIKSKLMERIIGVIIFLAPFLIFTLPEPENETTLLEKILMSSIVSIVFLHSWWLGYQILRRRVPKGFGIFEDEF